MRAAIDAGVSAYVVGGPHAASGSGRCSTAAIARFHMVARLRTELAATKAALEERKIVDRAKGMLMKAKGIGEEEAYALLRRTAMDQGRKVVEVAAGADHRGGPAEMSRRLDVGYVPLLDAAPLIIAAEIGFAAEEGLELALHREMSWAALRDKLIWGQYSAAHMLAPVVDRPDRRARRPATPRSTR